MARIRIPQLLRWILLTGFVFLMLTTLFRAGLYLFFIRQAHPDETVGSAFLLGFRFDLRMVCLLMLVMLVLASFRALNPFRKKYARMFWLVLLTLTAFAVVLFYAFDFGHYAYLDQRLNASVLNYLEDAAISMDMVWQSYPVVRIVLGILIFTFLFAWLLKRLLARCSKVQVTTGRTQRNSWFVVMLLLFGLGIFGRVNQYPLRWSDAFTLGTDHKAQLALNPFESFFNTLRYRHSSYDEKKVRAGLQLLAPYFGLNADSTASLTLARAHAGRPERWNGNPPNVVLVICESFSGYKSSMWGNPLNTTPYFNKLTQEGLFFDRCFTPAYGTARGVWALITGIPDVEMANTASRNPAAVNQTTIINEFKEHAKFYFIGGSASWANIRGLLTNNISGLRLYEQEQFDAPAIDVWGISDKDLLLGSNKILAAQTAPFFAVIQTAGNHRPYTIPSKDLEEFKLVSAHKDSLTKYGFESNEELNAFRYTDFCFQKFMEAARKEKYFDNTLFVFVGDHGIPGNAGDMFPDAWTKQRLTSEHVPLLFYAPRFVAPTRNRRIASQIDVLPTIARICEIPYVNYTLGRDLLDTLSYSRQLAFIVDPDNAMAGVITDSVFYRHQVRTFKHELVSVIDNRPVPDTNVTYLRQLTEAFFETSKYLLLNNKKN